MRARWGLRLWTASRWERARDNLIPALSYILSSSKGMTAPDVQKLLYSECGLKGLSGISNDVRDLEASQDPRAAICARLFRLPDRPPCWDARGRAGRPRCLCLHGRHRRELGLPACPDRRDTRLAGGQTGPGRKRGRSLTHIAPEQPSRALRYSNQRGIDDRATHLGCAGSSAPALENDNEKAWPFLSPKRRCSKASEASSLALPTTNRSLGAAPRPFARSAQNSLSPT